MVKLLLCFGWAFTVILEWRVLVGHYTLCSNFIVFLVHCGYTIIHDELHIVIIIVL